MARPYLFFVLSALSLISSLSNAQTVITFPMEKAVFQRNLSNQGNITIAGTYSGNFDVVEAKLTNALNGNVVVDWITIQNNPQNSNFYGTINNVVGGWYKLQVRGKLNGSQVDNVATLNRVGVGEVFLIAGQSNAQGIEGYQGEVGAANEQVVSHNFNGTLCNNTVPDYPSFQQIFSDGGSTRSYLSKTGPNPWCYGKLGDELVARLGVPVVFFNAGSFASSSQNWVQSSNGSPTYSHYGGNLYCNVVGIPYNNLRKVMNYYASIFGVRAILWHQGETDNYAMFDYGTVQSNLNYVINQSRSTFGGTIPWVVSRVSVFNKNANGGNGNPNPTIISAQQDLANNGNQVFLGPATDDILGGSRSDEVHFYGAGLTELAYRWNAALDANFFSNANPIQSTSLYSVSSTSSGTAMTLTAPAGFSSYKWVRTDTGNTDFEDPAEATSQSITKSSGTYMCYMTNGNNNIFMTQRFTVHLCTGISSCGGVTYLSDLVECSETNSWGPIEKDKSNGESNAGDGTTITLNGVTYAKGLGVHAYSNIVYKLNGQFGRFISDIGVDDEVNNNTCHGGGGNVNFKVYKDGNLAYESPLMTTTSQTISLNLDVTGTNELRLEVTDGGDGFCGDHADWAGVRLHCVDTQPPSAPTSLAFSNMGQTCLTLNWNASTDNMEVWKYYIYKNGVLFDSTTASVRTKVVTGLTPNTAYEFSVKAKDYSGNLSAVSNVVSPTTFNNIFILADKELINAGQSATITATNCTGTITWSNGQTGTSITVSPADTTTYTATCTASGCSITTSNAVAINVIPNCKSTYNFVSTANDFTGPTTSYFFQAGTTITATNDITNRAKIEYRAGKSITLNPGFEASGGVVFKAIINPCPN